MSAYETYVVRWNHVRDDGVSFAPGAFLVPDAIVGSPVSYNLNYHHPIGIVFDAANDDLGCLVSVHLDFGREGPRTDVIVLDPVYRTIRSTRDGPGRTRVLEAFLLQVSLITRADSTVGTA